MNGTNNVTTSLSFRNINSAIALSGGTPGQGADGIITISATTGGQVFGKLVVNVTACEVGRYTVPRGKRLMIIKIVLNAGTGGDMTHATEITLPNAFPIVLGELYLGSGIINTILGPFPLEAGTMLKLRSFTNTGSPTTRKLSANIVGILATTQAWDSLKLN